MLNKLKNILVNKWHTCAVPEVKQESIVQTLEALISDYDRNDLVNALGKIENDLGWKVLRAALIKEYMNKTILAMEHTRKTGEQIEAAYESGCANTMYDTATHLIDTYKDLLVNKTQAVENVRPTEE